MTCTRGRAAAAEAAFRDETSPASTESTMPKPAAMTKINHASNRTMPKKYSAPPALSTRERAAHEKANVDGQHDRENRKNPANLERQDNCRNLKLEPVVGFEPTTVRLQIGCSTTELNRPIGKCERIVTERPGLGKVFFTLASKGKRKTCPYPAQPQTNPRCRGCPACLGCGAAWRLCAQKE